MRRSRALAVLPVVAVAAALSLAGCTSSSGTASSSAAAPAASGNGVADLSADQILAQATDAAKKQSSVHVVGAGQAVGSALSLDLSLQKGGPSSADITTDGSKISVVNTGDTLYLKADKAFWTKQGSAAAAAVVGDKWVKAPSTNEAFASLGQFTDLGSAVDGLLKPSGTISRGATGTVDGRPAVALKDDKGGLLWIATTGDPLPLKIEGGAQQGSVTFDWGAAVNVTAPADSDVVDLSALAGIK